MNTKAEHAKYLSVTLDDLIKLEHVVFGQNIIPNRTVHSILAGSLWILVLDAILYFQYRYCLKHSLLQENHLFDLSSNLLLFQVLYFLHFVKK